MKRRNADGACPHHTARGTPYSNHIRQHYSTSGLGEAMQQILFNRIAEASNRSRIERA